MAIWLINKEWWTIMTNTDISKWFQLDIIVRFSENYVTVLVIQSCPTLQSHGLSPTRLLCPWNSPGKNTWVDYHFLLQGIFPTQGSNLGPLHCRQIRYHLSYFQLYKMNTFWGSKVQMITIDNNTVFYTWNFPRVELGYSYHHQLPKVRAVMDMLISLIVVIISQAYV